MRNPIPRCTVCHKPIIKMRKVWMLAPDGHRVYYLTWARRKYCGGTCEQRAYRKRKALRLFGI